jgi:hypothetical protein
MRCKKCGKRLKENEKFCTICGYYNDGKDDNDWNNEPEEEMDLLNDEEKTEQEQINESVEEFSLKADSSGTKSDEFFYKNEKFLEAYIGEDYKLIKKNWFNIYAFILNWMYILYRKMYITGILGLVITGIVLLKFQSIFLIYVVICMCALGLSFNKIYILTSKYKVERLLKKYEGSDEFTLESICQKKGGVNYVYALIIYFSFLVVIFFNLVTISYNKNHNTKFFEENSENEATCISLVKTAYKTFDTNKITGTVEEATCKIKNASVKSYSIYIKITNNGKTNYVYFQTENDYLVYKYNTENITELQNKSADGTITDTEKTTLSEMKSTSSTYTSITNSATAEDKLINSKKNTEEKLNYVITQEEILR